MSNISIKAIVDVVSVLSNDSLEKNVYMLDTNKLNGSVNEGKETLETAVKKGDVLVWTAFGLEVESYVEISNIDIDKSVLEALRREVYKGTNIPYWTGTVIKDIDKAIPYRIDFYVGDKDTVFTTDIGPSIKAVTK